MKYSNWILWEWIRGPVFFQLTFGEKGLTNTYPTISNFYNKILQETRRWHKNAGLWRVRQGVPHVLLASCDLRDSETRMEVFQLSSLQPLRKTQLHFVRFAEQVVPLSVFLLIIRWFTFTRFAHSTRNFMHSEHDRSCSINIPLVRNHNPLQFQLINIPFDLFWWERLILGFERITNNSLLIFEGTKITRCATNAFKSTLLLDVLFVVQRFQIDLIRSRFVNAPLVISTL